MDSTPKSRSDANSCIKLIQTATQQISVGRISP